MRREETHRGRTGAITLFLSLFAVGLVHLHAEDVVIGRSVRDGAYQPSDPVLIRDNPELRNLRQQIEERGDRIQKTQEEIEEINRDLRRINREKRTLQNELDALALTNRQNEAKIHVTEEAVERSRLRIRSLSSSIENNTKNVQTLQDVLEKNYRQKNEFDLQVSGLGQLFLHPSFFDVLQWVEETGRYTSALHEYLALLEEETVGLERNRQEVLDERDALKTQRDELEDRKKIHLFSIARKEDLVNRTKTDEAVYQKLLSEKQGEFLELRRELLEYESRINYLRDPTRIPDPQPGLFRRPYLGSAPVTQLFGKTEFAMANHAQYGAGGHSGVDFGTPLGTEIVAAADGVVVGTGNTDVVPSCQSWGKWILVEHPFGLTTMYAHLSLIKIRLGQKVQSGDLIGYSGNSGFSTGAHLHFGVYDARGIKVVPYSKISSSSRCRGLEIPISAKGALINPELYLDL